MLKKQTRDLLRKKDLEAINKEHSNSSVFWERIRDESLEAIRDLTLISHKVAPDLKRKIFNQKTLSPFFHSIIWTHDQDIVDINLVMHLIRSNLMIMINEYSHANRYSPHLSQLTIEQLQRTIDICSDIAEIIYSQQVESKAKKDNRSYVFRSSQFFITDRKRFVEFIYSLIQKSKNHYFTYTDESDFEYLEKNSMNIRGWNLTLGIYDPDADPENQSDYIGTVNLVIDPAKKKAHINLVIEGVEIISQTLEIEYDERNNWYSYYTRK